MNRFLVSAVAALALVGCQTKPKPPIYDPPIVDPTPTPTPKPAPVPTGVVVWDVAAPLIGQQTVELSVLDATFGERHGDRVDFATGDRVIEYWVKSAAGTARLSVYAHFSPKTSTVSKTLEVR